jgi:hypothetical protein
VFLGVVYGISAALYESAEELAESSSQYSQRFGEIEREPLRGESGEQKMAT